MSDCRQCADSDWCAEHEDCGLFKPKPQTNADRIRAMTEEELAEWFIKIQNDHVFAPDFPTMKNSWLDWLKREVET